MLKSPIYDFLMVNILARGPTPDFNNGLGNKFNSDVSKQIRLSTGSGAPARNILVVQLAWTSLGQPTIRLRRYGWNTSKEVRKTMKVEEIQLADLASPGSLASNQ